MGLFEKHAPRPMARTLRVLARLLGYPDADLRAHLPELRAALHTEQAVSAQRLAELDALIGTLARRDALDVEADYVQLFDSGRRTALHLGEIAHLVNTIFAALDQRQSRYASVMVALLDLAGVPAQAVQVPAEEPLDDSWSEPAAFDGCTSAGQGRSDHTQPVHIVRRGPSAQPGATA
ncbi:MAG: hypothetical protein L6Q73_17440 [Aquabacterium sp.]|nr:hypothetical protein [Aquabacterium sp.]